MAKSSFHTERNTKFSDKPNEDVFLFDDENGIYIVLDGVSRDKKDGIYPNPSPSALLSKRILESIHNSIKDEIITNELTNYNALVKANLIAATFNKENEACLGEFLAGTVGVIGVIHDKKLYYAYIGDCIGCIINDKHTHTFTEMQTAQITKHKGEFTVKEIRNVICNNKGHPCGYGVINGQEGAKDFIKTGVMQLDDAVIFLSSDGCESLFVKATRQDLLNLSSKDLINLYTDNDNADDRTLIKITYKRNGVRQK